MLWPPDGHARQARETPYRELKRSEDVERIKRLMIEQWGHGW